MRFETVHGQTFPRVGLHRYFLRLPREACIDLRRWFWVSAQMLFLIYLTTFPSCVELNASTPLSVRLANESNCTATVFEAPTWHVFWLGATVLTLTLTFSSFGHCEMLGVRRSLADHPSASRTCTCCSRLTTCDLSHRVYPQSRKDATWKTIWRTIQRTNDTFWSNVSTSFVFTERSVEDYQLDKKVLRLVFLGYELIAGGIWKLDILIADLEDMQTLDASDIYLREGSIDQTKRCRTRIPNCRWHSGIVRKDYKFRELEGGNRSWRVKISVENVEANRKSQPADFKMTTPKTSTFDAIKLYYQRAKCFQMWCWKHCGSQNYRTLFNFWLSWLCAIKNRSK